MTYHERAQAIMAHAQVTEDWQAAAQALLKCVPKPRKRKARGSGSRLATATFANGDTVTMGFYSAAGKPLDWDRAAFNCDRKYRRQRVVFVWNHEAHLDSTVLKSFRDDEQRLASVHVPEIVSIIEHGTGEVWTLEQKIAA